MVRIELCGGSLVGAIEALRSNKDDGGATYSRQYVFGILAANSGVKIGKSVYVPAKSGEDYAQCHRFRLVGWAASGSCFVRVHGCSADAGLVGDGKGRA